MPLTKFDLIFGQPPEIGNPDHIIELKRRNDIQAGIDPISYKFPTNLRSKYHDGYEYISFDCPKCHRHINFDDDEEGYDFCHCGNWFKLDEETGNIFVIEKPENQS